MRGLPYLGWWSVMSDKASDSLGEGVRNGIGAGGFLLMMFGGYLIYDHRDSRYGIGLIALGFVAFVTPWAWVSLLRLWGLFSEPAEPAHDLRNSPDKATVKGSTGLLVAGKDSTFHNVRVEGFDTAIHVAPEAERNQFSQIRVTSAATQEPGERGDVVFKDGLLRLLEAVDGTDYGDVIRGTNQGTDALMGYFAASLLLRGHDDRPEVAIYGKREPARVSRRIPDSELGRLDWDNRREQLKSAHASEPVRFSAVTLDAAQFEKHLAWYLARANRLGDAAL